jgi:hypothetical protein
VNGSRRRSQLAWSAADQAMSSLSNFALSLFVARAVTAREFGAFSVALALYTLLLGASRAYHSEPALLISRDAKPGASAADDGLIASTWTWSLAAATLLALASFVLPLGGALLIMALFLPVLLYQDLLRYLSISASRSASAFRADFLWATTGIAALSALTVTATLNAGSAIAGWASAGALSILFLRRTHVAPRRGPVRRAYDRSRSWYRINKRLGVRFLIEFGISYAGLHALLFVLPVVLGLEGFGSYKLALLPYVPINLAYTALHLFLMAHASRADVASRRLSWAIPILMSAGAAVLALALTIVPDDLLQTAFGSAQAIVLLDLRWEAAFYTASMFASSGALIVLRLRREVRYTPALRLVTSGGALIGGTFGALTFGVQGALIGGGMGQFSASVPWHWYLARTKPPNRFSGGGLPS